MIRDLDLLHLDATPSAILDWQLDLLEELRWSESERTANNIDDLKLHRDLVRYIGDGLMWKYLSPKAYRTLSRDYSEPPGISNQWASLAHVIRTARELVDEGIVPLITDIAHAIQTGDIIGVSPDVLLIIECKDRDAPTGGQFGGRLGRQITAMNTAVSFLADDIHGAPNDNEVPWVAFPPGYNRMFSFESLVDAVKQTRIHGESLQVVENGDVFLASRAVSTSELQRRAVAHLGPAIRGNIRIAGPHRLVTDPPHDQPPLSSWPISVEDRADLMSQEIVALHLVNLGPFLQERPVRVSHDPKGRGFVCTYKGVTFGFGDRFINDVLVGCEIRSTAVETFHSRLREFALTGSVDLGPPIRAVTLIAYRDGMIVSPEDPT